MSNKTFVNTAIGIQCISHSYSEIQMPSMNLDEKEEEETFRYLIEIAVSDHY